MTDSKANRRAVLGAGALVAGATALLPATQAHAKGAGAGDWTPAIEAADSWLDKAGTRHRMVFDTTSADAAAKGLRFAGNFYAANQSGYGLGPETLGVVLILRAEATPFGYGDAVWKKYGSQFAKMLDLTDEQADAAKSGNPLMAATPGPGPAMTLSGLRQKGASYAVCGMATHGIAMMTAKATGGDPVAVEAEFKANLIPGALIVAAGIVAVNRAQEHGYALAYVG